VYKEKHKGSASH